MVRKSLFAMVLMAVGVYSYGQVYIPGYDPEEPERSLVMFPAPEAVEEGREEPRSFTLPYESEEDAAQRAYVSGRYLTVLENFAESNYGSLKVYSCDYKLPFAWVDRQIFLYIEEVSHPYEIHVNGVKTGYNQSARTPAEFDLTRASVEGMNKLEIRVIPGTVSEVLNGAGNTPLRLNGKVHVIAQPRVRIRDFTASYNFEGADATMELGVMLRTHLLNARNVRMHYKLLSPSGDEVASAYRDADIGMKTEDTVRFFMQVPKVLPWTHESPQLYKLILKTQHEGRFTEYVSYDIGFRNISVADGQLRVNGYPLTPVPFAYRDRRDSTGTRTFLAEQKRKGFNTVVLFGYPQKEYFYNICDELGLYVSDIADINTVFMSDSREIGGNPSNDPVWKDSYLDRALSMYFRSWNHPSVAMFSIANESANGYNLYESYLALKGVEPLRPVIYLHARGDWNTDAENDPALLEGSGNKFLLEDRIPTGPVTISPQITDNGAGSYTILNNATVTDLKGELRYEVKQGMKKISSGALPVFIRPGESATLDIPKEGTNPKKKQKYEVSLEANLQ